MHHVLQIEISMSYSARISPGTGGDLIQKRNNSFYGTTALQNVVGKENNCQVEQLTCLDPMNKPQVLLLRLFRHEAARGSAQMATGNARMQTSVGTVSLFGFKTPIPYPFGAERTGYLVTDLDRAMVSAKSAGG
jgi:hypothetical protein